MRLLIKSVFCCSSMDINWWQVSSSPVSLRRFSYLCNFPILSFLGPPTPTPAPQFRSWYVLPQVQGYALYNSPLPKSCCFNYILSLLPPPTHPTWQAMSLQPLPNQPTDPFSPLATMPSSSHMGPGEAVRIWSSSRARPHSHFGPMVCTLSHNFFVALHVSDLFSFLADALNIP